MPHPAGIRSLAVSFPRTIRTNDYWREHHPELITQAEQKSLAKIFSACTDSPETDLWTQAMMPYLSDPFRGTLERRILGPDESSLTLEYDAAMQALEAANLTSNDVDLTIVSSVFPEQIAPGNAAFLAHQLGLQCAAWNLDSMCASSLVALHTACSLIRAGEYRNILVVASCSYSRFWDEKDTLSFFVGDGAGAFIVSKLEANQGVLGTKIINTKESCGTFFTQLSADPHETVRMLIRVGKNTGKQMPYLFSKYFRECCFGALEAANVTVEQIDFFVFYTATAWYSSFCTHELGIDPKRTIDIYPQYGNISTASVLVSLHQAAECQKIRPNDLVLVYSHGFVANAAAVVMRWGAVALGSLPKPGVHSRHLPECVGV